MTTRDSNLAVARLFEEIAQSLEVAGEQGHRLRAYRRAARGVAAAPEPLEPRHVLNTLPLDELRSQLLPRFGR